MSRIASNQHRDFIIKHIEAEAKRLIDSDDYEDYEDLVADRTDYAFGKLISHLVYKSSLLQKDLKIEFDWENYSEGDDWQFSPNGFWFLRMWAGGDWEWPVYFVVYWDGSNTRAYVPKNGNVYNRADKKAYGNDETSDEADILKTYGSAMDPNDINENWTLMEADINKRITI